jgi:YD repeat-containing protein
VVWEPTWLPGMALGKAVDSLLTYTTGGSTNWSVDGPGGRGSNLHISRAVLFRNCYTCNSMRLTYPGKTDTTYDYDQFDRVTAVRDSSGRALAAYRFDDRSGRTGLTYANGAWAAHRIVIPAATARLNSPKSRPPQCVVTPKPASPGNAVLTRSGRRSTMMLADNERQMVAPRIAVGGDKVATLVSVA